MTFIKKNNKLNTNKQSKLSLLIMGFFCLGISISAVGEDNKKPNFVWLLSEDNSQSFLNLYDEQGAKMPNIEALAKKGLVFNHAFSNAAVCSTARTTLATGSYAPRLGLNYHRKYTQSKLPEELKPIAKYLKDAGYYTSNDVKTDFNFILNKNESMWSDRQVGADWRKRDKDQPFFHMQSWVTTHEKTLHFPLSDIENKPTIHNPDNIKLPPIYPDTKEFRYTYARYLDSHVKLDAEIGKVIDKLKKDGLLENTFVFYFGDHGGVLPGTKGYVYERGLHVPLVVRIPENFRHLLDKSMQKMVNARIDGFVSFVDFAPTLAHLAGLDLSKQYDGKPFLGPTIDLVDLNSRDTAFGYADRFDEKLDLVRTLRKGDFKYIRHFQPMNPDGLFNQYRYKQIAYKQWKQMFLAGELNAVQSAFFEQKAPEALYDLKQDPFETHNLAQHPKYKKIVLTLRDNLSNKLKAMPDLAFYPEYWQDKHAFSAPVLFGNKHKNNIAELIDIANLQLQPFGLIKTKLKKALVSTDIWKKYWALITLSRFAEGAISLSAEVESLLLSSDNLLIKARCIEFLALATHYDPAKGITTLVASSHNDLETLEIFNIAAMLHDVKGYKFNIPFKSDWKKPMKKDKDYSKKRMINEWMLARTTYLAK